MDPHYTELGQRDNLAALEVVTPEGFIADTIIPVISVEDQTGVLYYKTTDADSTAQTDRVEGVAPTATQIADSSTTFATAERIKRYAITPKEVKQMGGIEKADAAGAKSAKRSVLRSIESSACALVLKTSSDADDTFDPAKIQTKVQTALDAMELYEGRSVLVSSSKTVRAMIQNLIADNTHGKVLARIVGGSNPATAMTGLNFQAWKDALALYLGLDDVILGHSSVWNVGAAQGRFAIMKHYDDGDEMAHKSIAVFARRVQFLRDGTNPFYIETVPDRDKKNNYYDAWVYDQIKALNSGAAYVFGGVLDA